MEIRARDLRAEAREAAPPGGAPPVREPRFERPPPPPEPEPESEPEHDTSEMPAVEPGPAAQAEPERVAQAERERVAQAERERVAQAELQGVTASADWSWDDPEDFSAPV